MFFLLCVYLYLFFFCLFCFCRLMVVRVLFLSCLDEEGCQQLDGGKSFSKSDVHSTNADFLQNQEELDASAEDQLDLFLTESEAETISLDVQLETNDNITETVEEDHSSEHDFCETEEGELENATGSSQFSTAPCSVERCLSAKKYKAEKGKETVGDSSGSLPSTVPCSVEICSRCTPSKYKIVDSDSSGERVVVMHRDFYHAAQLKWPEIVNCSVTLCNKCTPCKTATSVRVSPRDRRVMRDSARCSLSFSSYETPVTSRAYSTADRVTPDLFDASYVTANHGMDVSYDVTGTLQFANGDENEINQNLKTAKSKRTVNVPCVSSYDSDTVSMTDAESDTDGKDKGTKHFDNNQAAGLTASCENIPESRDGEESETGKPGEATEIKSGMKEGKYFHSDSDDDLILVSDEDVSEKVKSRSPSKSPPSRSPSPVFVSQFVRANRAVDFEGRRSEANQTDQKQTNFEPSPPEVTSVRDKEKLQTTSGEESGVKPHWVREHSGTPVSRKLKKTYNFKRRQPRHTETQGSGSKKRWPVSRTLRAKDKEVIQRNETFGVGKMNSPVQDEPDDDLSGSDAAHSPVFSRISGSRDTLGSIVSTDETNPVCDKSDLFAASKKSHSTGVVFCCLLSQMLTFLLSLTGNLPSENGI